nr:unnamed protein product [Digitaria exilis]
MGPLEVRVRKLPLLTNQRPHRSSKQTARITSRSAIACEFLLPHVKSRLGSQLPLPAAVLAATHAPHTLPLLHARGCCGTTQLAPCMGGKATRQGAALAAEACEPPPP